MARATASEDHSCALRASTDHLPSDWRRPRGRPRQSWLRTIESDLKQLNLGLHSALRRASDGPSWRRIVETAMLFERATWWWWCSCCWYYYLYYHFQLLSDQPIFSRLAPGLAGSLQVFQKTALTRLLVLSLQCYDSQLGDRKGIRPVESSALVCWWERFDWSFARLTAPVVNITSVTLSSNNIQNGDILVLPANPRPPGEWPLKQRYMQQSNSVKVIKENSQGHTTDYFSHKQYTHTDHNRKIHQSS